MGQMSFSDFEYAGKRKQTRQEQVVPWSDPAIEEALYEITSMRQFARLTLGAPTPENSANDWSELAKLEAAVIGTELVQD